MDNLVNVLSNTPTVPESAQISQSLKMDNANGNNDVIDKHISVNKNKENILKCIEQLKKFEFKTEEESEYK